MDGAADTPGLQEEVVVGIVTRAEQCLYTLGQRCRYLWAILEQGQTRSVRADSGRHTSAQEKRPH